VAVTRTGEAKPVGNLPSDQIMSLDIVLKLRNQVGLDSFLKKPYDPSSPSKRHFLTLPEFTERFGTTQAEYDAVVHLAQVNGFEVVGGTRDGMDVQIKGPVSAVETASI
jgi:subtilase family serine protease